MRTLSRLRALLPTRGRRPVRPSVIDTGVFDQKFYADITSARLSHFQTLGLPISGKSVLDVGAGVGHLSTAIAAAGGDVTCIDGREENILRLRELYPDRKAHVVDVETDAMLELGKFDGIFCYGLLYHLFDPLSFIRRVSRICNEWLVIETCISDSAEPILRLVPEENANYSQAIHAMGCRPSSAYVIFCLKVCGFENVYVASTLPDHPQFRYKNRNDGSYLRGGNLMRNIFVASRTVMRSAALTQC